MNTGIVSHYAGIKRFLLPVAIVLLGLVAFLFGYLWALPSSIALAIASGIAILVKNKDRDTKSFFQRFAFFAFALVALVLVVGGISAVIAAATLVV